MRQARDRPSRDHGIALDADIDQKRRRDRAEHHVDARVALAAHDLDRHVLEAPGGEDQLDREPHRLRVERLAGHETHERSQACLVLGDDPHALHVLAFPGRRGEGRGNEGDCQHQRDCRIRTSNAQPFSVPVLA